MTAWTRTIIRRMRRNLRARYAAPLDVRVEQDASSARVLFSDAEIRFQAHNMPDRQTETADFALTALSLVALSRGKNFRLNAPVSRAAHEAHLRYMMLWQMIAPRRFAPARVECPHIIPDPAVAEDDNAALCLSGGLDSSYAMLRNPGRYRYAVLVKGADYPVDGPSGFDEVRGRVKEIATLGGLQPAVVETNLRRHFRDWEGLHIGIMVACLQFAKGDRGRGAYAADYSAFQEALRFPWGNMRAVAEALSSPVFRLDHLHADTIRTDKITFLAASHPEILPFLSICFESTETAANCGQCHKCQMTRLGLRSMADRTMAEQAEIAMFGALADPIGFVRTLDPGQSLDRWRSLLLRLEDLSRRMPEGELRREILRKRDTMLRERPSSASA